MRACRLAAQSGGWEGGTVVRHLTWHVSAGAGQVVGSIHKPSTAILLQTRVCGHILQRLVRRASNGRSILVLGAGPACPSLISYHKKGKTALRKEYAPPCGVLMEGAGTYPISGCLEVAPPKVQLGQQKCARRTASRV